MTREAWIAVGIAVAVIGVITFIGAVRLLLKLLRMRKHIPELGTGGKVAFWGSLIYTFFPLDLLPDPIYLDDMAVLGTALVYLTRLWRQRRAGVPLPQAGKSGSKRVLSAPRR